FIGDSATKGENREGARAGARGRETIIPVPVPLPVPLPDSGGRRSLLHPASRLGRVQRDGDDLAFLHLEGDAQAVVAADLEMPPLLPFRLLPPPLLSLPPA